MKQYDPYILTPRKMKYPKTLVFRAFSSFNENGSQGVLHGAHKYSNAIGRRTSIEFRCFVMEPMENNANTNINSLKQSTSHLEAYEHL